jgi:hypothetical protein
MSSKSYLISFLKGFDLFGESFTFKIRKQKYYTSIVGGLTSLIFILYSLYYVISNLYDFLAKNNRSLDNEVKSISDSGINFNVHDYFTMAVCVREDSMAINTELLKYLKFKSYLVDNKVVNKRLNSTSQDLKMENCTGNFFQGSLNNIYQTFDFNECQCLSLKSNDAQFRSTYNIVDRQYLQLEAKVIDDRINKYLKDNIEKNNKLYLYFPSFNYDGSTAGEPLKMNIQTEVYDMIPNNIQYSDIFFNILNFTDYNSLYDDGK